MWYCVYGVIAYVDSENLKTYMLDVMMIIGFENWLKINAFQSLVTYTKVPCSLDLKIPAAYLLP